MTEPENNLDRREAETAAGRSPSPEEGGSFFQPPRQPMPLEIGRYRILNLIGQGGMGAVYLAEQENPRRTVALKVIKAGSMSRSLLRRFELEAHVLGRLQHPGIVPIFEAGMFDLGHGAQPFFAMEYVRGRPLTELALERGGRARERLELVAKICDAVHHAHQKGVIHRDLKPGNILVDPSGQPRILDFGVARATDGDIQLTTMQTDVGQLVGTLPYMSPEQVAGDPDELDIRSDVYALGVIAYELLAGRLPLNLERKTVAQAARIIAETDHTPLSATDRMLRGDVETIVAKALEKDKARRYQSAADLGADIRRYLGDEPIVARPTTALYRYGKFAKRNKGLVAGLAAAMLALVAGMAATAWKWREATRERDSAIAAKKDAQDAQKVAETARADADAARKAAEEESKKTHGINDFLVKKMLGAANPSVAQGREITIKMVLDEAVKEVESSFPDQPVLEASVRGTIGETYLGMGQFADARTQFQKAHDLLIAASGPDDIDTLTALVNIAVAANYDGHPDQAAAILRPAIPRIDKAMGPESRIALISRQVLATSLSDQGKFEDALGFLKEVMETQIRVQGEDDDDTQVSINNYAYLLGELGRNAESEPYFRKIYESRKRLLGPTHPRTLTAMSNLAVTLSQLGEFRDAETLLREGLEICRKVLGENHPDYYDVMANLGSMLINWGRVDEAGPLLEKASQERNRLLGPDHPTVIDGESELIGLYRLQGKTDKAIELGKQVVETCRRVNGPEHPDTLNAMQALVASYYAARDFESASSLASQTLEGRRKALGEDHPDTIASRHNLGSILLKMGRLDEAEPILKQAMDDSMRVNGPDDRQSFNALSMMGLLRHKQGRDEEAVDLQRRAWQGRSSLLGSGHGDTADAALDLAESLRSLKRHDEAESVLKECLKACEAAAKPDSKMVGHLHEAAAALYEAWGKPEEAAPHRALVPGAAGVTSQPAAAP